MKKILMFLLCVVFAVSLFAVVGCDNDTTTETETEVGFSYDIVKADNNVEYAVLKQYTISDEWATKVANGNYADIMQDIVVNEYKVGDKTYEVREVAASAFANQSVIRSVTFGPNVKTIGSACLAGCPNLEKLTVPFVGNTEDAVNDGKVLGYLFGTASATGMTSTTMNYNATGSKTYYIPDALKEVTVTGNKLSDYAFYGMALEKVNLTGSVEEIGSYAFYGMASLISYELPASVKKIGDHAFAECAHLAVLDLTKATALEEIGDNAFEGCELLGYGKDNALNLPAELKKVGEKAFYNCKELKAIDFSATKVRELNEYAFYGCAKLESVKLAANTKLGLGVFGKCEKLEQANVEGLDTAEGKEQAFDLPQWFH